MRKSIWSQWQDKNSRQERLKARLEAELAEPHFEIRDYGQEAVRVLVDMSEGTGGPERVVLILYRQVPEFDTDKPNVVEWLARGHHPHYTVNDLNYSRTLYPYTDEGLDDAFEEFRNGGGVDFWDGKIRYYSITQKELDEESKELRNGNSV